MTGRLSDDQLAADLARAETDAHLPWERRVAYLRELQEARAALRQAGECCARPPGTCFPEALGGGS